MENDKIGGTIGGTLLVILLICSFFGYIMFSVIDSYGCLSKEETKIVTITDKWTDYNNNFYIIDSNDNIYKLFSWREESRIPYRYKQIVVDDKYKLTVKTPHLFKDTTLLLNEEKI